MAKPKHGSRSFSPALALIAPAVAGSPIPIPTFLCPFIERDIVVSQCGIVADKYVQGPDALWRKTDTWTLFGSTCSPSPPQSSQSSHTPVALALDSSVLPAGWDNASSLSSSTESSIILALAIVLASSICIFIIGCLIWRRRKKKARDLERKLGHEHRVHDDDVSEKDSRHNMRIWEKATARWKSNVRQSARRRRRRHALSSTTNRPTSPTLSALPQPSPVPSRRGSIASQDMALSSVIEPPATPRSPSPPTYRASFVPRYSSPTPSPDPTSISASVASYATNQTRCTDTEPLPYTSPTDGHVAIDDKSQLSRIRELASSPPILVNATSTDTIQSGSAPEWHEVEDDLEAAIASSQASTRLYNFGFPPSFPPPPSKADVPSPFDHLDDRLLYYGDAGDILGSLPVPVSSRFSLGAFPSAPPIDDPILEPSAPCLEGEDELFQDWDTASSHDPDVPTPSDPGLVIELSISSTSSSASRAPLPCTLESAARDGILPRYHS